MTKIKLISFFILLFCLQSYAQTFEWAKKFGGNSDETGCAISIDKNNNIYTVGMFGGTVDFDPGTGVFSRTSSGYFDFYVNKIDSSGNFKWAATFGGYSNDDQVYGIVIDDSSYLYITGFIDYKDSVDFDPGPGIHKIRAKGGANMFILKLDSLGAFVWVKLFENGNLNYPYSITLDNKSNIYFTGFFQNTVDFDPSTNVFNLTAGTTTGSRNTFICKLTSNGDFVWAKSFFSESNYGHSIRVDDNQSVYVAGIFSDLTDFDPGIGTYNINPSIGNNIYITKLDSLGNLDWAKSIGGLVSSIPTFIPFVLRLDDKSNIYLAGGFNHSSVDFDPSNNAFQLSSIALNGQYDAFVCKYSNNGDFIWGKPIIGTADKGIKGMSIDSLENLYIVGYFKGTVDFDPSYGTYNIAAYGNTYDIFVSKLDGYGNFIWAEKIGGNGSENTGNSICLDSKNNIFTVSEFSGTIDCDPGVPVYSLISLGVEDVLVHKLSQKLCSNVSLNIDSLSNIDCNTMNGYGMASTKNTKFPVLYQWNTNPVDNDSVVVFNASGLYRLKVTDANNCFLNRDVLIDGPKSVSSHELEVELITNSFRSGFPTHLWLDAFNNSCTTASGDVKVVLDNFLVFDSATVAPDVISGDTLIWSFASLDFNSPHIKSLIYAHVSSSAMVGDTVCVSAIISPIISDSDSLNNTKYYCQPVINGYDPNDKKVYPAGICDKFYIKKDQKLTYTIRFQNTGNADAINIYVLDTIDSELDLSTLKVLVSSHPMITDVLIGGVLKFQFDSISLPDSSTNEPLSHGYIIYEIKPLSAVFDKAIIKNKADIFFDFNVPVSTNQVFNTVAYTIPPCGVLTSNTKAAFGNKFELYPNPANDITIVEFKEDSKNIQIKVLDVLGNEIKINGKQMDNKIYLYTKSLPSGLYLINILIEDKFYSAKLIKE